MKMKRFACKVYRLIQYKNVTHKRIRHNGPYYKSKLALKSNSSKILPVNCKFVCDSTPI